jgi:hypothetical protein
VQVESEQGVGLDGGAAPDHEFCPPTGNEVEGGELLKDPHRIVGAENSHGAVQPDALRAGSGGRQDDGGGRIKVLLAVVFTDAERVEAHFVSPLDFFNEVVKAVRAGQGQAGVRVGNGGGETVDANFHGSPRCRNCFAQLALTSIHFGTKVYT